jgi:hypothetical protein
VSVSLPLVLAALGLYAVERLTRDAQPLRAGPWPGLTPRGAYVLLLHALVLATLFVLLAALGLSLAPPTLVAYLALAAAASVAVLVLAEGLVRLPGVGVAVCAVFLLPPALLSLARPAVSPPLELVGPATLFDIALWVRADDLQAVLDVWPGRAVRRVWRRRERRIRAFTPRRAALASAIFGLLLALLAPPSAALLGTPAPGIADHARLLAAAGLATGVAAASGYAVALTLARRRTGR